MSDRDDIRTLLAETPDAVFSRIDVITALPHITPANIDTGLSWMVKNKQISRIKHGHYQYMPDAEVRAPGGQPRPPQEKPVVVAVAKPVAAPKEKAGPPAWLADNLAPYQRVRLFIEANGPTKRQTLATMLANFGTDSLKRIASMCSEGVIHANADDLIALGPHPKAAQARKHWDPRRERPLPPASNTTRLADRNSAAETVNESPVPEIVPAPAPIEHPEKPMSATVTKLHADPTEVSSEALEKFADEVSKKIIDGIEKDATDFGSGGGGGRECDCPMVMFSYHPEGMQIDIDGEDDRALTAIRAVLFALA